MGSDCTSTSAELESVRTQLLEQKGLVRRLLLEKYEPIAIIGVGLRFPGDNNTIRGFTEFLDAGRSGTCPIPEDRWDVAAFSPADDQEKGKVRSSGGGFLHGIDQFDPAFFNISPKEARCLDPQQRLALETSWEALENANIDPTGLRHGTGGVYFAASANDYTMEIGALAGDDLDGYLAAGLIHAAVSGRLSYFLGLRGPSITIDTACSASLVALHLAAGGLRRGECDIALCGGVNAIHHPLSTAVLSDMNALAADGRCKTFDESADGYGRAEGCGVLVLKRLSDAKRDGDTVLALVRGSAVRQDGESAGLTAPNGIAQEALLRAALADSMLEPREIQYVEAHGTGTPLGDPIEMAAINEVFAGSHSKDHPLLVGSVKTNLGHLEAAAGVAGVVKTVLQLRRATVFPHLNMDNPSSRIPWDRYPVVVPTRSRPWVAPVRRAMVSSFGFAGTIASTVLEQAPLATVRSEPVPSESARSAPAESTGPRPDRSNVFTLSVKTPGALAGQIRRYRSALAEQPGGEVADMCYTANVGRAHFRHRVAGVVGSTDELDALLGRALASVERGEIPSYDSRKIAFLFTGQGAQYSGMAAGLYPRYPTFTRALDECDELLTPLIGRSVKAMVLGRDDQLGPTGLDQTQWTQAALFAVEYSLARLWLSWGITPSAVAGHSIGEVVAATVAGLFTVADAARLVAARGRLMGSVRATGRMVSVAAAVDDVVPLLAGHQDLAIAAVNAPRQCVVSGGANSVAEVVAALTDQGFDTRPLATSNAFHSPLMAEITDELRERLRGITFRETQCIVVSAVTGRVAKRHEIADVEYWVRQVVEPVRFQDAMQALHRRGRHVFVEIGPGSTLTGLAKRCVPAADHVWLTSLRKGTEDDRTIVEALAKGYVAGLRVSWPDFHQGRTASKVELPAYAFDHKRYWLPVGLPGAVTAQPVDGIRPGSAAPPANGLREPPAGTAQPGTAQPGTALPEQDGAERHTTVAELIRDRLAAALGYADPTDLDPHTDFGELGVDSLVAVELRKTLSAALRVECPASAVFEHSSVHRLARFLDGQLGAELQKIG
jgi:acyl transferase domain-containing protein